MSYILKNHFLIKSRLLLSGLFCLWLFSPPGVTAEPSNYWLLVDLSNQRVILYLDHNRKILELGNISIGQGGVSQLHYRGDKTTPIGEYQVTHINLKSRYQTFIGLNYPTPAQAKKAYLLGTLSFKELRSLLDAAHSNTIPPENTALGGMIGIHALGQADPKLHEMANWTDGCVAINNEQMDQLLPYIREGMRVVIR